MANRQKKIKRILYFGLDPSRFIVDAEVVHLPLIRTVAKPFCGEVERCFAEIASYSHLLFTSRTAVNLFFEYVQRTAITHLNEKVCFSVGQATSKLLASYGFHQILTAKEEHAEGVINLLQDYPLSKISHLFFPRSAQGRDAIPAFLDKKKIKHTLLYLYDTHPQAVVLPNLALFDTLVFTSPSTVSAFFSVLNQAVPPREKCSAIGPVTEMCLDSFFCQRNKE